MGARRIVQGVKLGPDWNLAVVAHAHGGSRLHTNDHHGQAGTGRRTGGALFRHGLVLGGGAGNSSCPQPEVNTPRRAIKKFQPPRRTKEEGRENLGLNPEENLREEDRIANRPNHPTFLPPLTLLDNQGAERLDAFAPRLVEAGHVVAGREEEMRGKRSRRCRGCAVNPVFLAANWQRCWP